MEEWKDIIGYEGFYQVSNLGNVKGINKKSRRKDCRILKGSIKNNGYKNVTLIKNFNKEIGIHRLVAQTFIPNPENKPQVNHIDGNKQNNCVENLEWCTRSENQKHSYKTLGNKSHFQTNHPDKGKFGKDNKSSKKVNQYDLEGNFIKIWDCIKDVKRILKINDSSISCVCKGKRNKAGGYKWQYA